MKTDIVIALVCTAVSAMALAFLFVRGMLGTADGLRRFLWTVPVRGGDSVRLTMSAGELTLVKAQFIYFGVAV